MQYSQSQVIGEGEKESTPKATSNYEVHHVAVERLCAGERLWIEFRLQSKIVEGFWDMQAAKYGIQVDDEITHVNGSPVENELEFVSAFL